MGQVRQTVTTDARQSQREIEKLNKQVTKLREEVKNASETGKKGQAEHNSLVTKGITEVGKMAAAWVSVQGGIQLATSLAQDFERVASKAASIQFQTADQSANLLRNIASLSQADQQRVLGAREQISSLTGQTPGSVATVLSDVVSAKGAVSLGGALQSAEFAFKVAPESPQAASAVASGILDTARISGSEDPKRNLGLIAAVAANSRSKDLAKVAQFSLPAISSGVASGASFKEAAAINTALGFLAVDDTGQASSTSTISLFEQLKGQGIQGAGPLEQIRTLQADPALRQQFLNKASFERRFQTPISGLLGNSPESAALLKNQLDALRAADPIPAAQGLLDSFQRSPEQQTAALRRRLQNIGSGAFLSDRTSGTEGAILDALPEISERTGIGGVFGDFFLRKKFQFERQFGNETPVEDLLLLLDNGNSGPGGNSAAEQAALREVIEVLKDIRDTQRRGVARGTHTEGAR